MMILPWAAPLALLIQANPVALTALANAPQADKGAVPAAKMPQKAASAAGSATVRMSLTHYTYQATPLKGQLPVCLISRTFMLTLLKAHVPEFFTSLTIATFAANWTCIASVLADNA